MNSKGQMRIRIKSRNNRLKYAAIDELLRQCPVKYTRNKYDKAAIAGVRPGLSSEKTLEG